MGHFLCQDWLILIGGEACLSLLFFIFIFKAEMLKNREHGLNLFHVSCFCVRLLGARISLLRRNRKIRSCSLTGNCFQSLPPSKLLPWKAFYQFSWYLKENKNAWWEFYRVSPPILRCLVCFGLTRYLLFNCKYGIEIDNKRMCADCNYQKCFLRVLVASGWQCLISLLPIPKYNNYKMQITKNVPNV